MPVILKNQVVDSLRAARNADDTLSRLRENSWENQRKKLVSLVESPNWRFGPAELLATFPHHLVVKSPSGALVQVEWTEGDKGYELGRATVHETATPVADLGRELMETAKAAVDKILDEDYDGVQDMIASMAEAMDSGGDLQRRVHTEVTLQSLQRQAWWHGLVGMREGIEELIPKPQTDDVSESLDKGIDDLLAFLREQATNLSGAVRSLSATEDADIGIESVAQEIAEDVQRAIFALVNVDRSHQTEALAIYEAVMTATPLLLNGIAFLADVANESADSTHDDENEG